MAELELNVATKNRSMSMDVHNKRRAAQQASPTKGSNLPDIGGATGGLPSVGIITSA